MRTNWGVIQIGQYIRKERKKTPRAGQEGEGSGLILPSAPNWTKASVDALTKNAVRKRVCQTEAKVVMRGRLSPGHRGQRSLFLIKARLIPILACPFRGVRISQGYTSAKAPYSMTGRSWDSPSLSPQHLGPGIWRLKHGRN